MLCVCYSAASRNLLIWYNNIWLRVIIYAKCRLSDQQKYNSVKNIKYYNDQSFYKRSCISPIDIIIRTSLTREIVSKGIVALSVFKYPDQGYPLTRYGNIEYIIGSIHRHRRIIYN